MSEPRQRRGSQNTETAPVRADKGETSPSGCSDGRGKGLCSSSIHKFASPTSFQNDKQLRQQQLRTRTCDWRWWCGGLMPLGHSNQVTVSSRRMISTMNTTTIAIRIPTKTPIVTMIMTVIVCKNKNSRWQKSNSKKTEKRTQKTKQKGKSKKQRSKNMFLKKQKSKTIKKKQKIKTTNDRNIRHSLLSRPPPRFLVKQKQNNSNKTKTQHINTYTSLQQ